MVYDTSLMMYASHTKPQQLLLDTTYRGHVVESVVGAYLLARAQQEQFDVLWWRDTGSEVDFVLRKGSNLAALEVKSGTMKGVGGGIAFMKQYPNASVQVIGDSRTSIEDFLLGKVPLF